MTDWASYVWTRRWMAKSPPPGQWTIQADLTSSPVGACIVWRSATGVVLLDTRDGYYYGDVGAAKATQPGLSRGGDIIGGTNDRGVAGYAAQTGIGRARGLGDPCCDSCAATGSLCSCPQQGPEYSWQGSGSDLTAPCRPCSNSGMSIALQNNADEGLGRRVGFGPRCPTCKDESLAGSAPLFHPPPSNSPHQPLKTPLFHHAFRTRAPWSGFGDANAFATASADLATLLGGAKVRGDAALTGGDYGTAISEYQAGGNAGAVTVGPEIDNAGAGAVTQPLTQQAWVLNQSLAAITGSAQTDAQKAQGLLLNMITLYSQAIAAGLQALQGPPGPGPNPGPPIPPGPNPNPNPAPSPAPASSSDYTVPILAGSGVVAALIVGWAVMSKRGGL